MNKLKKWYLCMTILFLALTAGIVGYKLAYNINVWYTFEKNTELSRTFSKITGADEEIYNCADRVKQGNIDLKEVSKFLPVAIAPIGYPEYQNKILSPVDIEYYENIGDKYPVYVIKKGEQIEFEVSAKSMYEVEFCGNDSLPSNKRGWRLAKPFKMDGTQKESLLYVRFGDLISVCIEFIEKNPNYVLSSYELIKRGLMPSKRNISIVILTFADRALYSKGVFLSKDLFLPVFDWVTVICLFITAVLIMLYIMRKRKHLKNS